MIYLYKNYQEFNGIPRKCLKIGYTTKIKFRSISYRTNSGSRGFSEVGKREGDKMFERMFHVKYRKALLLNEDTKRRSEWCLWSQSIVDSFFIDTMDTLGEFLWKEKDTYLLPYLKERGKAFKVYKYLKTKFKDDNDTDILSNKSNIDFIKSCIENINKKKSNNVSYRF